MHTHKRTIDTDFGIVSTVVRIYAHQTTRAVECSLGFDTNRIVHDLWSYAREIGSNLERYDVNCLERLAVHQSIVTTSLLRRGFLKRTTIAHTSGYLLTSA
jgi:hypothetical protein